MIPLDFVHARSLGRVLTILSLLWFAARVSTADSIDFPGALETFPEAVNDAGQVVGSFDDGTGRFQGFLKSGSYSP